jgi:hypothetical protein
VVRGGIDRDAIERLRSVIAGIYDRDVGLHVHEEDIAEATNGRLSGFDLVEARFRPFLDRVFSGQPYKRETATSRRIQGRGQDASWQAPLELHLDSFLHAFDFTVNFWVPFDEAGVDAPGLQLLPVDYRRTRAFIGFSNRRERSNAKFNYGHFRRQEIDFDDLETAFGPGCLFRPQVRVGDVVIASNWIVHGTYRTPAMHNGRTNIELRFVGSCRDIATRPDASDSREIWLKALRKRVANGVRRRLGMPIY